MLEQCERGERRAVGVRPGVGDRVGGGAGHIEIGAVGNEGSVRALLTEQPLDSDARSSSVGGSEAEQGVGLPIDTVVRRILAAEEPGIADGRCDLLRAVRGHGSEGHRCDHDRDECGGEATRKRQATGIAGGCVHVHSDGERPT